MSLRIPTNLLLFTTLALLLDSVRSSFVCVPSTTWAGTTYQVANNTAFPICAYSGFICHYDNSTGLSLFSGTACPVTVIEYSCPPSTTYNGQVIPLTSGSAFPTCPYSVYICHFDPSTGASLHSGTACPTSGAITTEITSYPSSSISSNQVSATSSPTQPPPTSQYTTSTSRISTMSQSGTSTTSQSNASSSTGRAANIATIVGSVLGSIVSVIGIITGIYKFKEMRAKAKQQRYQQAPSYEYF
ncbi:hypothetical protein JAAARDRAFT_210994 [Jaapia argillacea MUCL 33604]|uniref:Uncharacterized protein n=1 Tax=Jaapia argillacea MUCL 33604 TaxID=933084 RepID=A0A067P9S8_9AGAM|nr:hypothetical protein JAAARDRAFT_210994 [Jaapia argillacea MUCL 33604]